MCRFIILCLISFHLSASPVANLNKIGEGEMDYLFWTLYKAELFALNKQSEDIYSQQPTLRITYFKSISKQALLEATQQQWSELGYTPLKTLIWLEPLKAIWPNVEEGDQLTFVTLQDGRGEFYFNQTFIGKIADHSFSKAFLSIWLSEKTSEPELRRKLLGEAR